jgi:hypothetical protein
LLIDKSLSHCPSEVLCKPEAPPSEFTTKASFTSAFLHSPTLTCNMEPAGRELLTKYYVSRRRQQGVYKLSHTLHPRIFRSYLPWREGGDQECCSSEETPCIAQRAGDFSWMSFGASTSAIFHFNSVFGHCTPFH